jgi:hypothetical protein
MGVNKKTVRRPDGVRDGELITVENDQEMVRKLFRQLILYVDISSGYYGMEGVLLGPIVDNADFVYNLYQ